MELVRRYGSDADKEWLWSLYKNLLKDSIEAQWGWDESYQLEYFAKNFWLENFIIMSDDKLDIGAYYINEHFDYYYVKLILIKKAFQNEGVGSHIISKLQSEARRSKKNIKLSVIQKNPVIRFYTNLGFKKLYELDGSIYLQWKY